MTNGSFVSSISIISFNLVVFIFRLKSEVCRLPRRLGSEGFRHRDLPATKSKLESVGFKEVLPNEWLGGRDSNPDTQIQSLQSYR